MREREREREIVLYVVCFVFNQLACEGGRRFNPLVGHVMAFEHTQKERVGESPKMCVYVLLYYTFPINR